MHSCVSRASIRAIVRECVRPVRRVSVPRLVALGAGAGGPRVSLFSPLLVFFMNNF